MVQLSHPYVTTGKTLTLTMWTFVKGFGIVSESEVGGFGDFLANQGTLKSLLQHHSSEASILQCSAFLIVQLSHPYMTTGKTIALTRWTFVGKIMSLLFNRLSRLVITFLPRSKHLLISWLPVTIYSDFGAQKNKVCHCFHCFSIFLPWSDGPGCQDLCFLNVEL